MFFLQIFRENVDEDPPTEPNVKASPSFGVCNLPSQLLFLEYFVVNKFYALVAI
jgi:hypothetical protein